MLLTLITRQPSALRDIVAHTPMWVGALLAALVALGVSQFFTRRAGLRRVLFVPIGMAVFSAWGMVSAFGGAPHLAVVLGLWLLMVCTVTALVMALWRAPTAGAQYDPRAQTFLLPGSGWPLLLILGIFLVKYAVGVELAMQPTLAHDGDFAQQIALVYGAFNGCFAARTGRLLRLARGTPTQLGASAT